MLQRTRSVSSTQTEQRQILITELIDIYRESNVKYAIAVCGTIESSLMLQLIYIYLPFVITIEYLTND